MCPSGTVAPHSTIAPPSDFRQAFEALDADHDGKISRDDLRKFYPGFSSANADEETIDSMISAADLNKNGFIEYDEFERVLGGDENQRKSVGIMADVFKVMDKDGDGMLSHGDLKNYMRSAGFSISDEDVKAMIKLGGGDETRGVSYDGLLKILAIDNLY